MGKLVNDRQERFAQLIAMNVPSAQAYAEAGFNNPKFPAENARKLRNKPHVRARIDELAASTQDMVELRRVMLDEFYVHVLKADRTEIYDENARLRPLAELRPEHRALIEGVDTRLSKYGEMKNVLMPSKLAAAAQLAKLHGLDKPLKIAETTADGKEMPTTADRARALAAFIAETRAEMAAMDAEKEAA
jgi:hypothetical protein